MKKINWCKIKKEGLALVDPNSNLASAYLSKANDALESIQLNKYDDWKISTAYYSSYFSLYAILSKIGIKCEIHACTIEFAREFLREYFSEEDLSFIKTALKTRIDTQYYVDRSISALEVREITKKAPDFYLKCKKILSELDEKKIMSIRKFFSNI